MMAPITKGRKKATISFLFNDVSDKKGLKIDRVTCRYCECEIAKNGTRMTRHIMKCDQTADCIKAKYLVKNWKEADKENREEGLNERERGKAKDNFL